MRRSRFPSSRDRTSLLRYSPGLGPREQRVSRRYKPGPSAIEFAFGVTLVFILAVSAFHAIGVIR
jgi:hypothetical protein